MNATLTAQHSDATQKKDLSGFRLIPRIEADPYLLSLVQTAFGKLLLLATFGVGLFLLHTFAASLWLGMALLALTTFLPLHRRAILATAPSLMLIGNALRDPRTLVLNFAFVAIGALLFVAVRRWPQSALARRPILFLISGFTALILGACWIPRGSGTYGTIWALVGCAASYLWFIAYALTDRTATPRNDGTLELAALHPLWGSTNVPFPKGAHYLRRIEARDSKQLAVIQLKGLKLLIWAVLLTLAQGLWFQFFHGYLRIPTAAEALAMSVHRTPVLWHLRWECQLLAFFENIFSISILGHQIIAVCRVAGFNALRNTYRPLSATTVAEFFNRFYYYFKELLVDFFFFPTFLRYFKGKRRLRLIFANFAAAGFGNAFYHFARDWTVIRDQGLFRALASFQVYLFYSIVLATALSISQLRRRGHTASSFFRARLLPISGVILFYALLEVFDAAPATYPLAEHIRFFGSLFFIHY
jgi:hypothetical protein